ncbi:MAG TPA: DciA family protein [Acidobacteriaceae bacterium]
MDALRDYIRTHLARSLSDPDARLAAAWTVACGRAMAGRGSIAAYDSATATVRILVADSVWLQQMTSLRSTLTRDLARISGLPVRDLHFELEKPKQPRIARINTD